MQKIPVPATDEVVALLKRAMDDGHVVILPRIDPALTASLRKTEPPLVVACCLRFTLTLAESRTFTKLLEHEHVSKEELRAAMAPDDDTATRANIVGVVIHRMRKKLAPYGIEIATIHGYGYQLAAGGHAKVRKLIGEHDPKHTKVADPAKAD